MKVFKIDTLINRKFIIKMTKKSLLCMLFYLFALNCIANNSFHEQQNISISGTVSDKDGTLPGVNITIKGTSFGVASDLNGNYNITVPNRDAVLVFSFIGYITQEFLVGDNRSMNVTLIEDTRQMEEAVVVGYGTQKKVNLTGAVDQVTSKALENRSVNNVTQALVGTSPNLNIQLSDGKPTQSPAYNIRGTTSIGQGGSALVLIDGVEGDPRMLNPNDIESISILKDVASSSIYGARATFGVVLITTKSPSKGKTTISYTANLSSKRPVTVPDHIVDSYPWAKSFNDAWARWQDNGLTPTAINKTHSFSQEYLAEIKRRWENPSLPRIEVLPSGEYKYYYSTNWYKELYKDSFFGQDHNISVSGGNDIASFYVTGRYNGHDGLYRYNTDKYSMYNLHAKGVLQVTNWLKMENNTEYANMKYHQPYIVGEGQNVWRSIAAEGIPLAPLTNPDGTLSMSSAYTVGDYYLGKNFCEMQQRVLKNKISAVADFFDKSLTIRSDYTFRSTDYGHYTILTQVPYSRFENVISYVGTQTNSYEENRKTTQYQAFNLYADYIKSFNRKHNFHFLVGYNYEQSVYKDVGITRNGIVYEDVRNIKLAVGSNITPSGAFEKWRIAGGFFRLNYNYKERYLLELNGRYDGSSKFPDNSQWAFFPSVSAGWRISQEGFWKIDPKVISNLKLRASYGSLGNGAIAAYTFSEKFSISQSGRIIGTTRPQLTSQPNVIPSSLTWETVTTGNIGLDIDALNNRLNFSGDVYRRWTKDMYTIGPSLPALFGTTVPRGNYASLETTGFELSIGWNDQIKLASKPFYYNVRFILSDYVAKITDYYNPEKNLTDYYVGQTIGEIWGYQVEGIFRSNEEAANAPSQSIGNVRSHNTGKVYKGDLKLKDLNNDNVIYQGLNRVGDSGDKTIIGNNSPRFSYGITLGADWNGFFFNSLFQGIMKRQWYPDTYSPFWGQYATPYYHYPRWQENKQYREELENFDAYLPNLVGYLSPNGLINGRLDRYVQNVAYIRLRTLNVGYTIPAKISNKISASDLRFYIVGENLWTWSPLYRLTKDIDVVQAFGSGSYRNNFDSTVDAQGDGFNYPSLKTISLGISITF